MRHRLLAAVVVAFPAAAAACNAVTGLGDLEFTRDPPGGAGGAGGGSAAWVLQIGDAIDDYPGGLELAPNGDLVLGGAFAGTVDLGAGPVQSANFRTDAFVARFDPTGAPLFAQLFDGGADDCMIDMTVDAGGRTLALVGSGPEGSCLSANYFGYATLGFTSQGLTRSSVHVLTADGSQAQEILLCDACDPAAIGPVAVATDAAGNVYVAGGFSGTFTLGAPITAVGVQDVLVAKLDPAGNPVWVRGFGGAAGQANATDIVIDASGNAVVTGLFNGLLTVGATDLTGVYGDVFVAGLDASGDPTWARAFATASYYAAPHLAAAADGTLITGDFYGTVSFGGDPLTNSSMSGRSDAFVVKLDANGEHVWSERIGEAPGPLDANQAGCSLAVDASGNAVVAGVFGGNADLGGQTFEAGGYHDAFVARLDPSGAVVAAKSFRGLANAFQGDLRVAASAGEVAVAGAFYLDIEVEGRTLSSKAPSAYYDDIYVTRFALP
ncbi:MAG: hypothetical protein IT372_15025 [Polyangiaceae bacterium]|nr:hypothetical protein [Polyangiaceae bacterium]